jgi:NAD(P)H-hydrate repair Nnr-like enzyme with NAD(P)H-hydrate epimerase domain
MQRAAAGLADEIRRVLDVVAPGRRGRVLLLAGSGNNGADTLYAGAELASVEVDVIIVAAGSGMHEEALAAAISAGATREDGFDHPIVIAVDVPSGINPDDGTVPDALVLPADTTVTFGAFKAGLLLEPASRLAGRIHLVDIGLAPDLELVEPILRVEG